MKDFSGQTTDRHSQEEIPPRPYSEASILSIKKQDHTSLKKILKNIEITEPPP